MWKMLFCVNTFLFSYSLDALANLVGQQNARYGIIKIFNALQEANANKHLLYVRKNAKLSHETNKKKTTRYILSL